MNPITGLTTSPIEQVERGMEEMRLTSPSRKSLSSASLTKVIQTGRRLVHHRIGFNRRTDKEKDILMMFANTWNEYPLVHIQVESSFGSFTIGRSGKSQASQVSQGSS